MREDEGKCRRCHRGLVVNPQAGDYPVLRGRVVGKRMCGLCGDWMEEGDEVCVKHGKGVG